MRTIQLNIPDDIDLKDSELVLLLAAKLYQEAKLTASQAAEMVGLSKKAFLEELGNFGVSIFSESLDDLEHVVREDSAYFGMWKDRDDLKDSSKWVDKLRTTEWEK